MTQLDEFLKELRDLKINLSVDGDQLNCRAPKGVITAAIGAALSARKQEIIDYLRSVQNSLTSAKRIPLADKGLVPTLSFGQQRLWFLYALEGPSATYNMPLFLKITGNFNREYFSQALNRVIERHEILSYNFLSTAGGPKIEVNREKRCVVDWIDISGGDARTLEHIVENINRHAFDLATDLLLRATVIKATDNQFYVALLVHHIVADGWSIGILFNELTAIYSSLTKNTSAELPALSIQYSDYAHWQTEELKGERLKELLTYWKDRLSGCEDAINLVTDRPRPDYLSYRGNTFSYQLDASTSDGLKKLCHASGCTLYMTLLAGFALFLSAHSGQDDIVIGSPVANRNRAELENLIGLFINTLPLRIDLSADPTIEEFLKRVKLSCINDFNHQEIPFEKIVEEINPPRSLNRAPLYQVAFDLQNRDQAATSIADLEIESLNPENISAKFDLSLNIEDLGSHLLTSWNYSEDIFVEDTIKTFAQRYALILKQMIENPTLRIHELSLLTPSETEKIFAQQGATKFTLPSEKNLLDLVFERVVKTPDRVAISFEDDSLSYRELDERSTQLAIILQKLGVSPEKLVAVYLDRSSEMIIALLGILKAGAAYIPIDPNFPAERLGWIIEDACPAMILTEPSLAPKLKTVSIQIQMIGEILEQAKTVSPTTRVLRPVIYPLATAYVIFTSGSTGRPKGVQVSHRALYNFLYSMQAEPGFTQHDKLLAVTTISFDIAGLEIFLPLICGGEVVLASRSTAIDGRALARVIVERGITTMQATPSTWRLLLETNWRPALPFAAYCGGEALPSDLSETLIGLGVDLWNLYGPTETTIWSAVRQIKQATHTLNQIEPIGHPILNTQLYVMNAYFFPQATGLAGELFIGGDGLARGYLNRPALTAQAYRPDPFGETPGGRLYGTGDLVARRDNDDIQFLGRKDHQVKIRGYRIELGEIESCFRRHPNIKDVVVITRRDLASSNTQILAYLVVKDQEVHSDTEVRTHLRQVLPDYMVPAHVVVLTSLPLTPNGKIDRKSLPDVKNVNSTVSLKGLPKKASEQLISTIWCKILQRETVDLDDNFFDLGGHSLLLTRVNEELRVQLARDIPLIHLFEYPTVRSLSNWLDQRPVPEATARSSTVSSQPLDDHAIAIIGAAVRFPGADDLKTFWENLTAGQESIRFFSEAELIAAGIEPELIASPNYIRGTGVLSNVTDFDAEFFSYIPSEAKFIDPQQRIFLETSWQALENAGYADPKDRTVGVFAGVGHNDYLIRNVVPFVQRGNNTSVFQLIIGNDKDFLATRVSYAFNLKGPSITVQTACSTSLVAVHNACQSLLNGECEMALAGGVAIKVPHISGYIHEEGMISSPDGHCRAFDIEANGTVWGSGSGAVILKPLSKALEDRDTIHAVIKGSAINNDGASKIGFTAPSVNGQATVIKRALSHAGVSADTIDYIETHGTGTALGDVIEISALKEAFSAVTDQNYSCALGSVKTNIGHLNTAAGIAGLCKTVLALQHKEIPPTLHFKKPHPKLNIQASPFHVVSTLTPWQTRDHPRRAGVSSFGIGGTNAHIILQEAPVKLPSQSKRIWHVFPLSAKTPQSLKATELQLANFLNTVTTQDLADVAFTLGVGRKEFAYRSTFVCRTLDELTALLDRQERGNKSTTKNVASPRAIFLFPGQGTQFLGMGRSLYREEPTFREIINYCAEQLLPILKIDLRDFLNASGESERLGMLINETWITQPLLFVVEYALAKLWISWGVEPFAMLGHSLGEYVAACLAEVFDLDTALHLVAHRGRLMWTMPQGSMLAVAQNVLTLDLSAHPDLSIASINSDNSCVLAGPELKIDLLLNELKQKNVVHTKLRTSHAFHSSMMDPILGEFRVLVAQQRLSQPCLPFVSNVTGTWITAEQALSADYWVEHLRATVQFARGLDTILTESHLVCFELGPKAILSSLVRRHSLKANVKSIIPSIDVTQHPEDVCMAVAISKAWESGLPFSWDRFYANEKLSRIPLPTYVFDRKRHWIDAPSPRASLPHTESTSRRPLEEWFYLPHWRPTINPPALNQDLFSQDRRVWLVFKNESNLCLETIALLQHRNQDVVTISQSENFKLISENEYEICASEKASYLSLLTSLRKRAIYKVIHFWSLDDQDDTLNIEHEYATFAKTQELGFFSLIALCKAMAEQLPADRPIDITVVANQLHDVYGTGDSSPSKATLIGPSLVIPQEVPQITIHCLDVSSENLDHKARTRTTLHILTECENGSSDPMVAYRGDQRMVPSYQQVQLQSSSTTPNTLKHQGVYVISGGLGKVGLLIAQYLSNQVKARVCLIGRTPLPSRELWTDLCQHDSPQSTTIQAILALERSGSEVLVLSCDIANVSELLSAFDLCTRRFGPINGVFHAAGLPSLATPFLEMTAQLAQKHFDAKVYGTFALKNVFVKYPVEFCFLISSSSAVLGGLGYSAYSAANIFLDHFASFENSQQGEQRWISINWDAWNFNQTDSVFAQHQQFFMTPQESMEALDRVLKNLTAGRMIVATGNLETRFKNWVIRQDWQQQEEESSVSLHARPDLENSYSPALTESEIKLTQIWQTLLGYEQIGVNDNFFELGGDSMLAIRLMSTIKEKFHRQLPLTTLLEKPSIHTLAATLDLPTESDIISPLVPLQTTGSLAPIFCMPGTGGSVIYLRELGKELAAWDRPFYGLQAILSAETKKPMMDVREIARVNIEAIKTIQPSGPYYLCGHSFGSWVALEMALQLTQTGQRVERLFILDTGIPSEKDLSRIQNWNDDEWLTVIARTIGQTYNAPLVLNTEALQVLTWDQKVKFLFDKMNENGLIDHYSGLKDVQDLVEMYKAQAQTLYAPEPFKINGLTLIRAEEILPDFLEGMPIAMQNDPFWGWSTFSAEPPSLEYISGNHLTMVQLPHVKHLAYTINQFLKSHDHS